MEKTQNDVITNIKKASTQQLERFMEAKRWWDVSSESISWTRRMVEIELTERYMGAM